MRGHDSGDLGRVQSHLAQTEGVKRCGVRGVALVVVLYRVGGRGPRWVQLEIIQFGATLYVLVPKKNIKAIEYVKLKPL